MLWTLEYTYLLSDFIFFGYILRRGIAGSYSLESPLDCKEIQPVHPKGNQSWIFIGRTDVEAETPILWVPAVKNWLIWKDPDAGKDWRWETGMTEGEMVGWHHWINGHEFEQAPAVGDGQGSLACYSPWGHKESDMNERLNWAELNWTESTEISSYSVLTNMSNKSK